MTINIATPNVTTALLSRCPSPASSPFFFHAAHIAFCVGKKEVNKQVQNREMPVITSRYTVLFLGPPEASKLFMSIVSGGQEGAWQVAACKGVRSWVERMEETVMAELATLRSREREGGRDGRKVVRGLVCVRVL